MRIHFLKVITLFLFISQYAEYTSASNPYIVNFEKKDYHAANKNWSIAQDDKGVIYVGNDFGLLEFNGVHWNYFESHNKLPMRSVAVSNHNTVFTGGYEEFGRWDRDISGQLRYTSLSSLVDEAILQENDFWKTWVIDSKVYFQSFNSIFVYDQNTVKKLFTKDILLLQKVRDEFWIQEMQGPLFRFEDDQLTKVEGSDFFADKDVRVMLPYGKDNYLMGTSTDGLYLYDGKTFTEWNPKLSNIFRQNELNCALLSSRGTYVWGTILNGIYETDRSGNILNHFSTETKLNNNTILGIYEDNLNNFWVALDRGMAYIQYLDNMSYYTDPTGNIGAIYDAIYWKDMLLLGTNQGVFYMPKSDLNSYNSLSKLKLVEGTQGQVWALRIIEEKLFCCHNKGLKIINENMTSSNPFSPNPGLYDIIEGTIRGQDIYLLSTYSHLKIIRKGTNVVHDIGTNLDAVKATKIDHLGNIWMEHPVKGVYRYMLNDDLTETKDWAYYGGDSGDGLPNRMTIFRLGGRINLLGDDKFFTYDDIDNKVKPNEKLNECFESVTNLLKIIYIKENLFWAISKDSAFKFYYDGYDAYIMEHYDIGIHKLSLVDAYENISIVDGSTSFICLDNGFLLYDDTNVTTQKDLRINKPFIEAFQSNNKKGKVAYADISTSIEIPYSYNSVVISFLVNDVFGNNLSFQYMLEGVSNEWSNAQYIDHVTYDRLPAGKYKFLVRAIDNLGNYSETVSCEFEISHPWYLSAWAYLSYIILFMLVAYGIWMIMLRRYRNIHLQKVRLRETKRLRVANEKLQSEVETKNAELFTQTSFIIQKNEIISQTKEIVDEFYQSNKSRALEPLYQRISLLLNNSLNRDDDWKMFLIKFEQKHPDFFKKLKNLYPQLTTNDLKLCACLKLNLDSKEIASFMNLSVRAIENSRYRLRKKLSIAATRNLNDFFFSIN